MDNSKKEKLRALQQTIDKLEKQYGKGYIVKTTIKPPTPEQLRESELYNLRRKWVHFIHHTPSTDLWSKEEFEAFLNNREDLLGAGSRYFEDGHAYYSGMTDNAKTIEQNTKYLDRLKEIYEKRFAPEEPEDHTKFTKSELMYLFEKIGLTGTVFYKKLSENNKALLLSKLLSCHFENGKKYKNGNDARYTVNAESANKIDAFLSKISKE